MSLEVHCLSDRNHNTDLNSANINECICLEKGTYPTESRDGGAAAGGDDATAGGFIAENEVPRNTEVIAVYSRVLLRTRPRITLKLEAETNQTKNRLDRLFRR